MLDKMNSFGEEEIIGNTLRKTTIRVIDNSFLVFANKVEFLRLFNFNKYLFKFRNYRDELINNGHIPVPDNTHYNES